MSPGSGPRKTVISLGRRPGSRDRLTSGFVSKLADDFEKHDAQAITDCREADPACYLRLVVALAPKELEIRHDSALDAFTDAELAALLAAASKLAEKRDMTATEPAPPGEAVH